ncbi:MAG: DUF4333 domain-containing protein [Actinobacteria bacterium]|nr:DUF4333 domain-containing protein [Actinomycetota bacterium]
MRRTTTSLLALVLTSGILVTGCSASTLDGSSLQDKITTQLGEQIGGTWTVVCPEAEPLKTGATFTCTATDSSGVAQTVNVTQSDDQGNITWEIPATDLDTLTLESGVTDELAKQVGGTWTVVCPKGIAIENGATFTCDATSADGQTETVNVTQTDDQGNVTWELAS